nr:DUF5458 family protein [Bacteroides fragilis]
MRRFEQYKKQIDRVFLDIWIDSFQKHKRTI